MIKTVDGSDIFFNALTWHKKKTAIPCVTAKALPSVSAPTNRTPGSPGAAPAHCAKEEARRASTTMLGPLRQLTAMNFALWLWGPTEDPTPLLKKKTPKEKPVG